MKTAAALLLLMLATAGAAAQTVWRCGPDGRSYSDVPCPEGRPFKATDDTPGARERQAAERVARREQALADRLRRERLAAEESLAPGAGLGTLGAGPPLRAREKKPAPAKPPRPASFGTWPAAAPSSPPLRG